jgi:hypothetical protein
MPIFSEIEEGRAEASIVKNETSEIESKNVEKHSQTKKFKMNVKFKMGDKPSFSSKIYKLYFFKVFNIFSV